MTEEQLEEIVENFKGALENWAFVSLNIDADHNAYGKQVYNQLDVINTVVIMNHILGNYIIGEMIEQKCSDEFMLKHARKFGEEMRDIILEYCKIDMRKAFEK